MGRIELRPEDRVKCQSIDDLSWSLAENDPNPGWSRQQLARGNISRNLHWKEKYVKRATYSAPFLDLVNSAKTKKRLQPRAFPSLILCNLTASESRKLSATAPLLMTLIARRCSKPRLTHEAMIQAEKIHFEISRGMTGLISPDHLLKARRLTAVKVSTA